MFVRDFPSTDDPVGGEYALAFGIHPDAWRCTVVDNECPEGLECATDGELKGHCVIPGTSPPQMPGSTAAQAALANGGASIRIISKELLDGKTLEQFACACYGHDEEGNPTCPSSGEWVVDPENCSACGDNAATSLSEAGRCLDLNNDRVPDLATLQAGVATITCAGVTSFGTNGTYLTGQGDGYYYPSGNQFPTSGFGYGGLGPAVVIEPLLDLPTSADCTITLTDKVTDKDGNKFDPFEASFTTEALEALGTNPTGQTVPVATTAIAVNFNADISAASVNNTVVQIRKMGGSFIAGTTVAKSGTVASRLTITLPTGTALEANTTYEIVVAATVADSYGQPSGAQQVLSFKTAAAAPPT